MSTLACALAAVHVATVIQLFLELYRTLGLGKALNRSITCVGTVVASLTTVGLCVEAPSLVALAILNVETITLAVLLALYLKPYVKLNRRFAALSEGDRRVALRAYLDPYYLDKLAQNYGAANLALAELHARITATKIKIGQLERLQEIDPRHRALAALPTLRLDLAALKASLRQSEGKIQQMKGDLELLSHL